MNNEVVFIVHTTNKEGLSCVLGAYKEKWVADGIGGALNDADFPREIFVTESSVIG